MSNLITPISLENLQENWEIVDHHRRTAKKKYITTRVAAFFSNMVLTVMTLFCANGLIHDHFSGSYSRFLGEIPYLIPYWKIFSGYFLKPGQSMLTQFLLTALVVFLLCFLVCGLFTLLVLAIYHPRRITMPDSGAAEKSAQLLTMARDARRYANRSGDRGSAFWALVFILLQFALVSMYVLVEIGTLTGIMELSTGFIMKWLEPYIQNDFTFGNVQFALFAPAVMLECMALYLGYALIGTIHAFTVQFMYRYKVPYSFVAQVEYFHVFADEEPENLTKEELEAKRAEQAIEIIREAAQMEKLGAYGRAKELYAKAAHSGHPGAMEHYARFWLIANAKDPGRYWLEKCVATGNASLTAIKNLKRLKWHRSVKVTYIK